MSDRPVYSWEVSRAAGSAGWLKHLWWIRESHGRHVSSAVCGRPKRRTLWPAFVPPRATEFDAAKKLLAYDAGEACSVCRMRAEGIMRKGHR